jgi:pre-mRNA-splicing helicase BRR2
MTDQQRDVSQYKYSAMSNLVLQADRRFVTRRNDEVTGDPESLAGRLSIRDMGSRNARDDAPKQKKKASGLPDVERGGLQEGQDVLEREQRKRKRGEPAQLRGTGILSAADALVEGIVYRPRTSATRATYDLIITTVANNLGDVSHEIVRSAADAVLEYLKDDDMKDFDKKKEIDDLLGASLSPKQFNELVNLGKKITDYEAQDEDEVMGDDDGGAEDGAEIDDRQGVAVVFDDNSEDEDGQEMVDEVRDESSEDEADVEDRPGAEEIATAGGAGQDRDEEDQELPEEEALIIDSGPVGGTAGTGKDRSLIPARDIDAYWLQRQIGSIYSDAHIQQLKTQQALHTLSGAPQEEGGEEKPLREIENDLAELFDYENHELVHKLIANRDKVVWLTRLARAEDIEARGVVEREIASEGLRWILDELRGIAPSGRGSNQRKMEIKMDIDLPASSTNGTFKAENVSDGSLVGGLQPKKLINLENLVFDQGNHLMTNPKVKLPEGSTKRTFKGYEEIHVPAPKKRNDPSDRDIPVTEMPEWARNSTRYSLRASQQHSTMMATC